MTIQELLDSRKTEIEFTDGQIEALTKVHTFLNSNDNFFLLAGYSGCGKTTISENIATAYNATLLAPTNAAVNRLRDKINNPSLIYSTIHSALFVAGDKKNSFLEDKSLKLKSVYIVDECSMIDKYVLQVLIKQAIEKKCKMIFMGDSFQLEPVGENPFIFNWEKSYPNSFFVYNRYELTEVKRYDGSLLKIATEMRINKQPKFQQPENSDLTSVKKFSKALAKDISNDGNYVVLTSTNERRVVYNEKIRAYKFKDREIDKYVQNNDILVSVSNSGPYSNGEIYKISQAQLISEFEILIEGRKDGDLKSYTALLYRHNNQMTLLIPNLTEASLHGQQIITSIKNKTTIVTEQVYKILVNKFTPRNNPTRYFFNKDVIIATYGYAISCHKAQGQEWDNVYIDASWLMPVWNSAKWFYTAITRAKCKVEITQNKYLKMI